MVPVLSLVLILLNLLLGIVIPIGLLVFIKKKYHTSIKSFVVGCGVMFLFAFVLEQIVHTIVLGSSVGTTIQNNVWALALYGGFMAGLFEEVGRFVGMKLMLKKEQENPYNALMYGAGHGGFEMFFLLSIGMINNLIYSIMINTGQTQVLINPLDEKSKAVAQGAFDALIATPSWHFLLSPVERLAAISAQIALSVIVWFAVTGKRNKAVLLVLAIVLHALLDVTAVLLAKNGVNVAIVEVFVWIVAIIIIMIARGIWKKQSKQIIG